MRKRFKKEWLWQFIINDGKATILTVFVIYFLNVYLTGDLIPLDFSNLSNMTNSHFFTYITVIFLSSTIPMELKHRKETLNSLEIKKVSSERQIEILNRAEKVKTKNERLFRELMKQVKEEAKIIHSENEFQYTVREGKSTKEDIFKIIVAVILALV